ncbi:MAG TPA: NAD-dependent epimerase/dehydratase family protein [Mycobacteriales bacterium]|nr:NAD-dependent epimerase/dehydratase family protein [Mycobacteriales bacterium]
MTSLLVLGGTSFVGRHIVEAALTRGHQVTVFNRGRTNPHLFPQVAHIAGDRQSGELDALRSGSWDMVVDVSGYYPRQVHEAVDALRERVGHYTFISTVSVYAPTDDPVDESSALLPTDGVDTEKVTDDTYGPLKVLCEEAARSDFPGATVVRPGIVAGPHDPTGRFTAWVRRATRPGPMLASRPDAPVQVVHARDLAELTLQVTEQRVPDTFNAVGPTSGGVPMAEVIAACVEAAGVASPEVVWVDEDLITSRDVPLPLFLPRSEHCDGLFRASCRKAEAQGLVNRPLVETARDTLAWLRTPGQERAHVELLSAEQESEILAAWAAR